MLEACPPRGAAALPTSAPGQDEITPQRCESRPAASCKLRSSTVCLFLSLCAVFHMRPRRHARRESCIRLTTSCRFLSRRMGSASSPLAAPDHAVPAPASPTSRLQGCQGRRGSQSGPSSRPWARSNARVALPWLHQQSSTGEATEEVLALRSAQVPDLMLPGVHQCWCPRIFLRAMLPAQGAIKPRICSTAGAPAHNPNPSGGSGKQQLASICIATHRRENGAADFRLNRRKCDQRSFFDACSVSGHGCSGSSSSSSSNSHSTST